MTHWNGSYMLSFDPIDVAPVILRMTYVKPEYIDSTHPFDIRFSAWHRMKLGWLTVSWEESMKSIDKPFVDWFRNMDIY
jgi:hypothetical protein